ncbi:hypothetical protein D9M68_733100 [compost metagenome]
MVALFLVHRHQPPERSAPGQPDRRAVEFVEQQVVLGGAAVVRGQLRLAIADGETRRIDQKEMRLGTLGRRPGFELVALLA